MSVTNNNNIVIITRARSYSCKHFTGFVVPRGTKVGFEASSTREDTVHKEQLLNRPRGR